MSRHRVIVAKPWHPSPVASSDDLCLLTLSFEDSDDASTSFFTTTGTPTINTILREANMPEIKCYSFPDLTTDLLTNDTEKRQSAGREFDSQDRDDVVVTISDQECDRERKIINSGSDNLGNKILCASEELCCLHGRPCALGRSRFENTQQREFRVPGYEPVKIDCLENPPDSFTRRQNQSTQTGAIVQPSTKLQKSSKAVYRCLMPSDMSSLVSPALTSISKQSAAQNDDIYENIDCYNQNTNFPVAAPPQESVQTACDTTVISHPDLWRRQPLPTLNDFYLGAMRKRDAEKFVKRRTCFRFYHRVPSNAYSNLSNLHDHVSLYIVYKTSKGRYCHYAIQRVRGETPAGSKSIKYFYVDCMEELPPRFNSLDALIRYYSVYVQLDPVKKVGGVEVFPVPKRDEKCEKCR